MHTLHLVICADAAATGRVDNGSMPQQALMELLVTDIHHTITLQDGTLQFIDACEWFGVQCSENGDVTHVNFSPALTDDDEPDEDDLLFSIGPGGSVDVKWMPSSVEYFGIPLLQLEGTVETASLPQGLQIFNIAHNLFQGEFHLESLPRSSKRILIHSNQFQGSLNIAGLPSTVIQFIGRCNHFSGSIDLRTLPGCMEYLDLRDAGLSGSLDMAALPQGMTFIDLQKNGFGQERLVIPENRTLGVRLDIHKFGEIVKMESGDADIFIEKL